MLKFGLKVLIFYILREKISYEFVWMLEIYLYLYIYIFVGNFFMIFVCIMNCLFLFVYE